MSEDTIGQVRRSGSRLFGEYSNQDPGIWRPKIKKLYSWKINLINKKHAIFLFCQAREEDYIPQREHPALQNIILLHFCLSMWAFSAFLNSDPRTLWNPDPIRIRNTAQDCCNTALVVGIGSSNLSAKYYVQRDFNSVADPGRLSRIQIFSIPDPGSASKNLSI